jgi:hypothetical protein
MQIPNNWECLMLAQFTAIAPNPIPNNNFWDKTVKSYCTTMYVLNATIFNEILEFCSHPEMPLDDWLTETVQKRGTCYSLKKSIAWQVTGQSDIFIGKRKWQKGDNNENILLA